MSDRTGGPYTCFRELRYSLRPLPVRRYRVLVRRVPEVLMRRYQVLVRHCWEVPVRHLPVRRYQVLVRRYQVLVRGCFSFQRMSVRRLHILRPYVLRHLLVVRRQDPNSLPRSPARYLLIDSILLLSE